MTSGDFQKGYDPRRYALDSEAARATVAHRDRPLLSVHVTSIATIPPEFHVAVSPDEDADQLVGRLRVVIDYAEELHAQLATSPDTATTRSVGRFSTTIAKMQELSGRGAAGTVTPANYGKLDASAADGMKALYARVLSLNLTKMRHVRDWLERNTIYYDSGELKGELRRTAEWDQQREVVVGSMHVIEKWLGLLAWENSRPGSDPLIDELHRISGIGRASAG